MTDLGEGSKATELIPGNPAALRHTESALQAYGDLLHRAGEGLRRIDTSDGWTGEAADAFHDVYHGQPSKWLRAGDAFHDAAKALDAYIATLTWAQHQAGEAISLWNSGEEHHEAAQDKLNSAVSQLDSAGHTAATRVGTARDLAPEKPGFWSELGDGIGSFFSGAGHLAAKVGEDALTDLASVGNAMLHDPGSVGTVLGGLGLAAVGAGGEVGGAFLDATGVGAVLGVPAAAVSASAIAGGLSMAGAGMSNIIKDAAGPDRVHMESDGGGGGGKPPEEGKIDKEQTERIVLNLADSPVDISKMNAQLHDWPNPGLKEVIAIDKDGNILHLYP
ncbi:putative T7SS-secreted protein [Streptomyces sp. NPDC090442]|uniref:putative T7SS-secreted protein n=1 Tax=Streptomyces sp. NPDC090442 TaxID=3365962 RepID=UPI003830D385